MALPTLQELLEAYKLQTQGPAQTIQAGREGFNQGTNLASQIAQKQALDEYRRASLGERIKEAVGKQDVSEQKVGIEKEKAETPKSDYSVAAGVQAPSGKVAVINKTTGKVELQDAPGTTPAKDMTSSYAETRQRQFIMQDLPSNKPPTSVPGAAAGIQLAVRQGKALIAKPGSPQQIALASSDLARAVQRSSPQLETLKGASFANNYTTKISGLAQKITANPNGPDVPKLRKQIYEVLDDLEKSSRPYVERQLSHTEKIYKGHLPEEWETIKKEELGENIPGIEFQESSQPTESQTPSKTEAVVKTADDFMKKHGL